MIVVLGHKNYTLFIEEIIVLVLIIVYLQVPGPGIFYA